MERGRNLDRPYMGLGRHRVIYFDEVIAFDL